MGPEYNFSILLKNISVLYVLIALLIGLSLIFEMLCTIFVQLNVSLAFSIESINFVTKRVRSSLGSAGGVLAL